MDGAGESDQPERVDDERHRPEPDDNTLTKPQARQTQPWHADAAVVTIRVPADAEYVPLLRAACGQLAPRLGCTLAEISDLRLAVDEACGLLLRNCITLSRDAAGSGLAATFVVDGEGLRVTVETAADAFATPGDDEFGWTLLAALVDDFGWHVVGSTVRVEIFKKRADGR